MQHVGCVVDDHEAPVRHVRQPAPDTGQRVGADLAFGVFGEPLRNVRLRGGDPQHRRGDPAPDRIDFLHPVGRRKGQLVPRVRTQARLAVGQDLGPVSGEKQRVFPRQARIGLLQPVGDGVEVRVRLELGRFGQRVEPLREFLRRVVRRFHRNAEPLERDRGTGALRPYARVLHDDVAAEAVADEVDGLARREHVEQRLEVGDVVREPVALRLPRAAAVPAQVRSDRVPVAGERIDQELERRAAVHPAVHQEQLGRGGIAPGQHVVVHAAQRNAV